LTVTLRNAANHAHITVSERTMSLSVLEVWIWIRTKAFLLISYYRLNGTDPARYAHAATIV